MNVKVIKASEVAAAQSRCMSLFEDQVRHSNLPSYFKEFLVSDDVLKMWWPKASAWKELDPINRNLLAGDVPW